MKNELERRAYNFEVRAEEITDNENNVETIITGRPIVYDSMTDIGYFNEIIERGALDRTDLTDVRFLVNHNTDMIPLARSRRNNGNSTMQLVVDDLGLNIRVKLDVENNADAKALYSAVSRGDISSMSFMFSVSDEEWEDIDSEHPTRRIKAISSVVEVSAVTFPAYDATEIQARSKEALENARLTLEKEQQQREQSLESDSKLLELEKAKTLSLI